MRVATLAPAVAVVAAIAVSLCAPARLQAQDADATRVPRASYPPIADRDFALDAYQGAAVASYRIVGMGGTSLATAEGAASMSSNPASVASRLATWNDWFEWDFTIDSYKQDLGTDFDNNGTLEDDESGSTIAGNAGIMMYLGDWGVGISGVYDTREFALPTGEPAELNALIARLSVGRSFRGRSLTFGVSVALGSFDLSLVDAAGNQDTALVSSAATTLEAGFLWRPPGRNLRLGAHAQLPITAKLDQADCDPMDCAGYILPERVEFPWTVGVGVAWRRGPTPWNIVVKDDWRDEKALILAADVIVTGAVDGGAGLEEFLEHHLQPSGRDVVVSVRGGAEYEWVPGWFRVRGGLYWEPGRFEGVGGRGHLTLGFDARVWSFCFWGDRYRLRISAASDAAPGYTNVIASLGFWH